MTELLYQTDSYLQGFDASVTVVQTESRAVILDQTAFYPGGGGQPCDFGPALLVAWARLLDSRQDLPACRSESAGGLLAAAGILIWAAGVFAIVRHGGGLPMDAFPPPRLVTSGVYGLVAHPIYLGWVLACAGVALAAGSRSGLFVVTPTVALGCAALVIGLEGPELRRRFGAAASFRPWVSLPADEAAHAELRERIAVCALLIPTWLVVLAALAALAGGVPSGQVAALRAGNGRSRATSARLRPAT